MGARVRVVLIEEQAATIGLYLNQPEYAFVLSSDEKS